MSIWLELGLSRRSFSMRARPEENLPMRNATRPSMPRMPIATNGWSSLGTAGILPSQFQHHHAAAACASINITVKPGTKNFSNCSRDRRAGNASASCASNNAPELAPPRASSSNSSRSNRSRSSSRI